VTSPPRTMVNKARTSSNPADLGVSFSGPSKETSFFMVVDGVGLVTVLLRSEGVEDLVAGVGGSDNRCKLLRIGMLTILRRHHLVL